MNDYQTDRLGLGNNIDKPWCVVTGGSSGLGKELARIAVINKYQIINISRRPLEIGGFPFKNTYIKNVEADLSTQEGLNCAIRFLEKHEGEIKLFINSAGAMYTGKAGNYDSKRIAAFLHLTVTSPTALCNTLAKKNCDGFHMLNIGSMCSIEVGYGTESNSIYSSAKRYTDYFFSCLGKEFKRQGRAIYVSNAHPGPLETDFDDSWSSAKKGFTRKFFYGRLNTSVAAQKIWNACIVNGEQRFIRKTDILRLCAWRLREALRSRSFS